MSQDLDFLVTFLKVPKTLVESNIRALYSSLEQSASKNILPANQCSDNICSEKICYISCCETPRPGRSMYEKNAMTRPVRSSQKGSRTTEKMNETLRELDQAFASLSMNELQPIQESVLEFELLQDQPRNSQSLRKSSAPAVKRGRKNLATSQKLKFFELMADRSFDDIKDQHERLVQARTKFAKPDDSRETLIIAGRGRHPRAQMRVDEDE